MANASIFVLQLNKNQYNDNTSSMLSHINIGTGTDVSIKDLANTVRDVIGYDGNIIFDKTKPDGPKRKLIDISRLSNMGWNYSVDLKEGLHKTYNWYLSQVGK